MCAQNSAVSAVVWWTMLGEAGTASGGVVLQALGNRESGVPMSLDNEIQEARQTVVSDGYEMSIGEVMNLYRDEEIIIAPDFQRLFRWDPSRKTRFIESLLLGIPTPPIFVYQDEKGIWELIDGLQRLSTIFEFVGLLRLADGGVAEPSVLEGTRFLPSLANKKWEPTDPETDDGIGQTQQLQVKRARIRVEILKQESDPVAKYELFQRLNTGGAELSEQEVRNCVAIMINRDFHRWLMQRRANEAFQRTIAQTDTGRMRQADAELALRFFAFRHVPYKSGLDVHEYLDEALFVIASDEGYPYEQEAAVFDRTFEVLDEALGDKAFKRWDGAAFTGKFLMSVYEVVATGISKNLARIERMEDADRKEYIVQRCKDLWMDETFDQNSGAGVRGTTRLANLLPMAEGFFAE